MKKGDTVVGYFIKGAAGFKGFSVEFSTSKKGGETDFIYISNSDLNDYSNRYFDCVPNFLHRITYCKFQSNNVFYSKHLLTEKKISFLK
jgi:hypothetical protein